MKKSKGIFILIMGILLFFVAYSFDQQVNLIFKGIKSPLFDSILEIVLSFAAVTLVVLIIPSFILYKKNRKAVYLLWLTFIVSFILTFIIKLLVSRQRPVEAFMYPAIEIVDYSFPSTHAAVAFAMMPALLKHMPRQKTFWIFFAFLVAFSRVYRGVHFLSDVVFGALLGYFVGGYLLELQEKGKLWKK